MSFSTFNSFNSTLSRQSIFAIIPSIIKFTDPTSLSGLQLWLDANAYATLTLSGSSVTSWADRSGNGRNAVPFSGSPTYNATGFNNLPAIQFSATSLASPMLNGTLNLGTTVFVIFKYTGTNTYNTLVTRTINNLGAC